MREVNETGERGDIFARYGVSRYKYSVFRCNSDNICNY